MSRLIQSIGTIDSTIRELEKNNSKLENGHFVFARDKNNMLIDQFKTIKDNIIAQSQDPEFRNPNLLEDVGFLDKVIRELEKINSKIENGNIPFAWRDNRRVLAELQNAKKKILSEVQECVNEE